MNVSIQQNRQAGFTLVELAVVMIIIGLLIGGILKGQELIANAQISSTVAQAKGIDGAVSTFQDSYQAMPGDFARAVARLPNCTAPCANGNGNARINHGVNAAAAANESLLFWIHLNNADLLSGVNGTNQLNWGEGLPASNMGGGYVIGFTQTGAIPNATAAANARAGHYLTLMSDPTAAAAAGNALMTASKAARFDRKMDDGAPNAGTVRAIGGTGGAGCADLATTAGIYQEALDQLTCSLAIRIQQ